MFPTLLRLLLTGYLFFSKPFGYIHLPGMPIFLGEIVLAVGLVEHLVLRWRWRPVISRSAILKVLLVYMMWCAFRFATSLHAHLGTPIEVLRDSSIWYYGAFAFLVASYATYDRHFTADFLRWFTRVAPWLLLWTPILFTIGVRKAVHVPGLPLRLNAIKPGDIAVTCSFALATMILGLSGSGRIARRYTPFFIVIGLGGILISGSQNRGGLVASMGVVVAAFWLSPRFQRRAFVVRTAPLLLTVTVLVVIVNPRIQTERREVSVRQLTSNVRSILGHGEQDQTSTEEWRLDLWKDVVKDSVSRTYALQGQGFGPNLYMKYKGDKGGYGSPLRNPHSSHLDVLARSGVTGFALWVLLWITWWTKSIIVAARHRRVGAWAHRGVTISLSLTVTAYLVNSAFDPALEGPHAGIWLWTLVGLGAAHFPTPARRTSRSSR